MARPQRNNVDYFPHECLHGRKMFVIESKHGNDGYAVWFKLLERLGDAEHHYLDLRDETQFMFLASIMKVTEEKFKNILSDLAKLGAIHSDLYTQHSIIWSDKFVESVQEAYERRNNKCMTFEGLCTHLSVKITHKPRLEESNVDNNTQRRGEEIKGEKRKVNKAAFTPPTLEEAIEYFSQNGYSEATAIKAWKHYDLADWYNSQGKKVSSWKQTFHTNWFKEEDKQKEESSQKKMVW